MSANDNPFSALDKMLFSSTPVEQKEPKKSELPRKNRPAEEQLRKGKLSNNSIDQPGRPVESTESVNKSGQSIDRTEQFDQADQSTQVTKPQDQSTGQLMGVVAKRPLGFYIPIAINEKIEEAVRYYQKKYNRKIDRSAVVSAALGDPKVWRKPSLDKLADKVIDQLRNRLSDRLSNRLDQSTR